MSRWWRDSLLVSFGPSRIRLARVSALPGGRMPPWSEVVVEPGSTALETLGAALQERRWHGTAARVWLHARHVRWMLLPFSEAIATDAEWLAYAQIEFAGVHGERARDWSIRVLAPRFGQPVPACALDATLLDDLQRVCAGADVRVAQVAPAFAIAFEAERARLRSAVSAFVLVQDDRFTLAVLEAGAWRALDTGRIGPRAAESLEAALVRADAGQFGEAARRLWICFDGPAVALPARLGDWDVVVLEPAAMAASRGWRSRLGLAGA